MKKLLLFIFQFICLYCYSQDSIQIKGQLLNNTRFAKVVIKKFGVGTFDIGAFPIKDGKFKILTPKDIEPGVYRFQYSQSDINGYIDLIIDGKEQEIDLVLDVENPDSRVVFTKSEENKKWYEYKYLLQKQLKKMAVLSQFIDHYTDKKDKIVQQAIKDYYNEVKKYKSYFSVFLKQNTWAAKMIVNNPIFFADPTELKPIQDFHQRNNFWKGINTTNPQLINTPLYTDHILNYMKFYMNPEMEFSETEMQNGFIESVDTIMSKFEGNEQTKKFAIKYLQLGFKEIGQEKVLQYIDQKYQETLQQCHDELDKEEYEIRMRGYEMLKVGSDAPEIKFADENGGEKTLKSFNQDQIILVFWASWCPHCREEMPKLQEWAKNNPQSLVLSISLDDDYTAFQETIKQYPNLLHYCDLQKWEGEIVKSYYVMATPTIFQLDKERKIVAKLSSFEQLKTYFEAKN
jgi:thiol-disulfide isomerase/thioredoxin